ncbi:hypothetical protein CKM354_000803100 [Cercospora kikuchii]|uniref:Uncharacterized protein n=1 Tax=Cercospora kikuchii TaxID=84275 RepID=A0A9P3CSB1_9PEZI|nr:uncharacterized protein CKM354_000803100 [Cercospora kikuchii]GIZ44845.1 hypothetical protein CKM354_000803100 [Cercospora kikuchii]
MMRFSCDDMRSRMWSAIIFALTASTLVLAQNVENFTGSLQIVNGQGTYSGTSGGGNSGNAAGSPAVQAQCPANYPVSCTNIQQPYYCCPADNYCSWANSQVACCPNGKTCSGYAQPTTTIYQQQQPTTVVVAPAAVTTYYQQPQTTVENQGYAGQYCKTLVAVGPGLPTTEAGDCGTILIVEADAIRAAVVNWMKAIGMVVGLQLLGGIVLMNR